MTNYKNLSGKSNVKSYDVGPNFIVAEFMTIGKDGCSKYKYSYSSAGESNVEHMKLLANQGIGLNSFINKAVRKLYESKW